MDEPGVSPTGRLPTPLRVAAAVVGLEAVGLVALGVGYLVSGLVGRPEDRVGAVLAGALAALVGAALVAVARGLQRCRSWAVSPAVVVQIMVVVVAVSLVRGGVLLVGLPLLVCAGVVLAGLAAPATRELLSRT